MNVNNVIIRKELSKVSFGGCKGYPNTTKGRNKEKFVNILSGRLIQNNQRVKHFKLLSIIRKTAKEQGIFMPLIIDFVLTLRIASISRENLIRKEIKESNQQQKQKVNVKEVHKKELA